MKRAASTPAPLNSSIRSIDDDKKKIFSCWLEIAERFIGWAVRPVAEVSDRADSMVNQLPDRPPFDVAIIAARFDLMVLVSKTHLAGEQRHLVLNASHVSLLFSATTARMVASFIDSGNF